MKRVPADGLTAVQLREAAATEFRDVLELVFAALAVKLGKSRWDLNPEGVYPDRVVVRGDSARLMAYPYTIDDANQVQIGEPVEVVKTTAPAAAKLREAADDKRPKAGVFIEAAVEGAGRWLIRVIKSGLSLNGVFYPDAVLREAARLFEGARVFQKSDAEHIKGGGKDIRNLIAGLRNVKFVEGAKPDTGELQAELVMIEPDGDVATKLREAFERDLASLFGFSIDADGSAKTEMREGAKVKVAKAITRVSSVDLIVEPGAGGELIRLIEAVQHPSTTSEEDTMRIRMIEAIKARNPSFDAANASDEQIETAYREAVLAGQKNDSALADEVRLVEARLTARELIAASTLPEAAKAKLSAQFREAKELFTSADVETAIKGEREYLAKFTESGKPLIPFDAVIVEDRSVKMGEMFDAFFDPAHKDHRSVTSFKEAYIEFTGDRRLTGQLRDCDFSRLRESAGANFREGIASTTFADALGDSITRRMQSYYAGRADFKAWERVAQKGSAKDFRTQERFRVGGYGNLPAVAQGGSYDPLGTPGDDKATFAVSKRGGTEDVTMEAIINDDVNLLRRIPVELALAAGHTLREFAFDFYRTNPSIYDGKALYHADHANLFSGALDATQFALHRLAMAKQVRAGSGKRLGATPKILLVAFEQQEAAYNLFVRGQNNDKTFVQDVNPDVLVVDYWTDGNDWCTVADPMEAPVLEINFLNGQEEPEIFVQDMANVGSLFSNDKITYKIRHIYGGGVLVDGEKFTTKAVVA